MVVTVIDVSARRARFLARGLRSQGIDAEASSASMAGGECWIIRRADPSGGKSTDSDAAIRLSSSALVDLELTTATDDARRRAKGAYPFEDLADAVRRAVPGQVQDLVTDPTKS